MTRAEGAPAWGAIELELPRGHRGRPAVRTPRDETRPPRSDRAGRAGWGAGAGGRAQRLRAASGARQAVVKIIGYRKGRGQAGRTLDYVARRERIDMETSGGETLSTREDLQSLLDEWSATFSERADGRDVMHLMVSFPEGVAPETAREIARATLPEIAQGRDWAFAVHDDTGHAHVHALVRMRGPDGRQLRTTRDTLQRWREATARNARARGVALEASPRWARGRGEKGERFWERAMRARGETPRRHRDAARDAIAMLDRDGDATTRFERLIAATGKRERAALAALSWDLLAQARGASGEERARLLRLAEAAARHGEALPQARTRRQALAAIAEEMRARGKRVDPEGVAQALARERDAADRARDGPGRAPRAADSARRTSERPVEPPTPGHDGDQDALRRHAEWLAAREARRDRDRDPGREPD
ncbi:MAG: relaxase/mobilization nuclease domain-containing protein [Hyphomonadaceae bacterium]|nr:relaxase/mobilization nuclease domain-containing protein [Hyphomonadaceae bacterium]